MHGVRNRQVLWFALVQAHLPSLDLFGSVCPSLSAAHPCTVPTNSLTMPTLLDDIRNTLVVDVDSMDPAVAARHTQQGHLFADMTSNQAIVYSEAVKEERAEVLEAACKEAKASDVDVEHQVADALDLLVWAIPRIQMPLINVFSFISERAIGSRGPTASNGPCTRTNVPCACLQHRGHHRTRQTSRRAL